VTLGMPNSSRRRVEALGYDRAVVAQYVIEEPSGSISNVGRLSMLHGRMDDVESAT
jgi:hypothetical protein